MKFLRYYWKINVFFYINRLFIRFSGSNIFLFIFFSEPHIFIRYGRIGVRRSYCLRLVGSVSVLWFDLIHNFSYFFNWSCISYISWFTTLHFIKNINSFNWRIHSIVLFFESQQWFPGVRSSEVITFESCWYRLFALYLVSWFWVVYWLEGSWDIVLIFWLLVDIGIFKSFVVRKWTIGSWWPLPYIRRMQSVTRIPNIHFLWAKATLIGLCCTRLWCMKAASSLLRTIKWSIRYHLVLSINSVLWTKLIFILICWPWVKRTYVFGSMWNHVLMSLIVWDLMDGLS